MNSCSEVEIGTMVWLDVCSVLTSTYLIYYTVTVSLKQVRGSTIKGGNTCCHFPCLKGSNLHRSWSWSGCGWIWHQRHGRQGSFHSAAGRSFPSAPSAFSWCCLSPQVSSLGSSQDGLSMPGRMSSERERERLREERTNSSWKRQINGNGFYLLILDLCL